MRRTEQGDRRCESKQQSSERSMSDSPTSESIATEKPFITLLPVASALRYSPPQSTSTEIHGAAPPCPCSQHRAMTLQQALYLLLTGKLVQIPKALHRLPLLDLFNHFWKELLEDPNWAITPAGLDYAHYGYEYILKEEARHFACLAYNMIHQEQPIKVPARYQRPQIGLPPITYTPEPMSDSPPVPPRQA